MSWHVSCGASPAAQCWVGRAREMAVLEVALAASCGGQGQLILLEGEPGIGKTRLLAGAGCVCGRPWRAGPMGTLLRRGGSAPFWPWIQILRRYLTASTPEILQAEVGAGAAALAQVIPEIRQRLTDLPSLPALEPAQERFRFFDSLTTFLQNAARRRPLVLIFDDLQWADAPSLLLLQFVAREVPATPPCLVGTTSRSRLDPHHPLTHACAELARIPTQQGLRLQGLSHHEVAHFLALTTGVMPGTRRDVAAPAHGRQSVLPDRDGATAHDGRWRRRLLYAPGREPSGAAPECARSNWTASCAPCLPLPTPSCSLPVYGAHL